MQLLCCAIQQDATSAATLDIHALKIGIRIIFGQGDLGMLVHSAQIGDIAANFLIDLAAQDDLAMALHDVLEIVRLQALKRL